MRMTKSQATEWVCNNDDDSELDRDELIAAFSALYGREPDRDELQDAWSHCCSAIDEEFCPECGNPRDNSSGIGHCEHECHIKTKIPDGVYFLHPEGSSWIAAEFRKGKCVDTTEASNAGTHEAANDDWSGCVPSDDDREVSIAVSTEIVREVMGDDVYPEMVIVMKAN